MNRPMRVWRPAAGALILAALLLTVSAGGAVLAQTPPPEGAPALPEAASGQAPAPPPTVLLPPNSPDAAAASDAAPPKPIEPAKRPRRIAAVIQALDKSTAETLRFEAPVNQPIRYKDIVITVHVCEDAGAGPNQRGAAAHLEIDSEPRPAPGKVTPPSRQLFRGWMFANAPGVHPFEHPVYDAWLIACKAASPPA